MTDYDDGFKLPSDTDPFASPGVQQRGGGPRFPSAPPAPSASGPADMYPCPCVCACGNVTEQPRSAVVSASAARHLRCVPCANATHYGPRWTPKSTTPVGSTGEVKVGAVSNKPIVVRRAPAIDPAQAQWEAEAARELEKARRQNAKDRWEASLPDRWTLEYDVHPEVEERISRLRDGNTHGTSLVVWGPFGSGKTWAGYNYARKLVDDWIMWPSEIKIGTEAEIVEPIANAGFRVREVLNSILTPKLKWLMIDDVGQMSTYRDTDARIAAFGKVLDWAYSRRLTVVITTNLTLGEGEELSKWIGPAAYERLLSMAGKDQLLLTADKRDEIAKRWEAEYQQSLASRNPSSAVRNPS